MIGDIQLLLLSVAITALGIILTGFAQARFKAGLTALIIILNSILTSIPAIHALSGEIPAFNLPGTLLLVISSSGLTDFLPGSSWLSTSHVLMEPSMELDT